MHWGLHRLRGGAVSTSVQVSSRQSSGYLCFAFWWSLVFSRGKAPSGENSTFECLGGVCRIRDTTADEESDPGTGIWIVCVGGYTDISKLYAWEMESTWSRRELAGQEWTKPCPRQEVFSLNKKTQYGVKVGKCPKCQGLHSTEHCSKEA